ncbi:MAG: hypothetical protein P0116_09275 [Candidatus Nitrosocosmicus sp.]|nr:hypothetical protein [Candidatus Nitrosocosmicus sp.]
MTISIGYDVDGIATFARYDSMNSIFQIGQEVFYQPKIISTNNQGEVSFSKISFANSNVGSNSSNTVNTGTGTPDFRQDLSGKYTNPKYGISEFEIPTGWYATESMNGNNGIILTILPSTTQEFFTNLNSLSNDETLPIINLVIQDKEDLKQRQSEALVDSGPSSLSTKCTELSPNSTSTINDKQFQISTLKCLTADKEPILGGIDFGHNEITKSYKFDSSAKIYVLQLVLSSEYSSDKIVNEAYLPKFQPILDDTIQTLKIE